MIAEVDKDGSGAIDFDEFVHMMTAKIGERDSKEELMKAFHIIDQDKNVLLLLLIFIFLILYLMSALSLNTESCNYQMQGKISIADIQRISRELGENFTEKEIQEMVEEADRDRKS